MSRIVARESAYKLIFEYLFSNEKDLYTFDVFSASCQTDEDKAFLSDVYLGVIDKYDELIDIISKYSRGFEKDRIYKADLAALLLGAYEIIYMPDIPVAVSIDQVLNIVKDYSTEKSASFVNGVLASIVKEYGDKK